MLLFSPLIVRCYLLLSLLIGSTAMAAAHDHIQQRAYWEDTSAQASWAQAQQQQFTPYDGVLGRGYTQSAIWTRLQIVPPEHAKPDDTLVLRIRPIYLDRITLFDPLDTSGRARITGDQTAYKNEEYKTLTHAFVIPAGQQPRFIWLRLEATSTTLMHVEALTLEDMQEDEHRLMLSNFFTLSLIALFLLVATINWLNYREPLYAAFVARNFIYFVYTAAFFGLHRYLLGDSVSAEHIDMAYNWLVVGTSAFSFWFEIYFLSEYEPPRWVRYIFAVLLLWSATAMTLLWLGYTHLSLQINMLFNGAGVVAMLTLSAIFIDDNRSITPKTVSLLKKKFIVGYYAIIAGLLMFSVLPYLGQMAGTEFSANGLVYYSVISGLEMTILMEMRSRQLRKANAQMSEALALSAQQVLIEKTRREESAQLLTMLMHELKNPLTVIDLAQQTSQDASTQEYVSRNVAIIRDVLDQCLNAERLSDGRIEIKPQAVNLSHLLHDLTQSDAKHLGRFQLDLHPATPTPHTDYQCLRIILSNLIDNAWRYGDARSPIVISTYPETDAAQRPGVCVSIANTTGIAAWPEPDKVFQKYYRSTGAKTISGTGLGLYLVRSLCTLLGGTCTYAPDETHVKFNVWLPN